MTSFNPQFNPLEFLNRILARLSPLKKEPPGLVGAVIDAKKTWEQALNLFNTLDNKMIDFAIYNLNAAERHYMALLVEAKRAGVTAWPENLNEVNSPESLEQPAAQPDKQAGRERAAHN